ncbi:hypothetical protein BJ993_001209 [Nocardioides aromaticivorans]|uniref:Uncharacterized protein n=1 Tax=Nocardioides aromaticivorans TaxID=200618 RepID=A0A7Z0CKG9_9ACTN|nr:hypothetical protein [Nocardioides aromaticivorans]NYI44129.1 hypothetical protein [Nocardioides aromaticivorans]
MGSNDEFGPDTETIRAWLAKRATYAKDARVIAAPRGTLGTLGTDVPRDPGPSRPTPSPVAEAEPEEQADPPAEVVDAPAVRRRADGPRPDSRDAGRSVLDALGASPPSPPTPAPSATPTDATAAGRSVVDALGTDQPPARKQRRDRAKPATPPVPAAPEPPRTTVTRPSSTVRVSAPAARSSYQPSTRSAPTPPPRQEQPVRRGRWTEPEEHRQAIEATTDVEFPVRSGIRRFLGFVLLGALLATGAASYFANKDRSIAAIGIAGVLAFLTLVVWAVRASCVTTKLAIQRGQLIVTRAGHAQRVDISGGHTVIAIVGEPGDRRWTVLFERPGLPLVVVNAGMVDPHWFTSALYRLRPELRPGWSDPEVSDEYAGVTP